MAKEFYFIYGTKSDIYDKNGCSILGGDVLVHDVTVTLSDNLDEKRCVYDCTSILGTYPHEIRRRLGVFIAAVKSGEDPVYFNEHRVKSLRVEQSYYKSLSHFRIIIDIDRRDVMHLHEIKNKPEKKSEHEVALMMLNYTYTGKINADDYTYLMESAWDEIDGAVRIVLDGIDFKGLKKAQQERLSSITGRMAIMEYLKRKEG